MANVSIAVFSAISALVGVGVGIALDRYLSPPATWTSISATTAIDDKAIAYALSSNGGIIMCVNSRCTGVR